MSEELRREERPDVTAPAKSGMRPGVPMNDPNYNYRLVPKHVVPNEKNEDRMNYHTDLGYGIARETDQGYVMGCKKDERDAREKAAQQKSERNIGAYDRSGDAKKDPEASHDTISIERGRIPTEE